jgi:AraC-like DNA-binding protein
MDFAGNNNQASPGRLAGAFSPSRAGDVRIGPIFAIPAVVKAHGVNPETVFARAGVDFRVFQDPDNRLSLESVGRLMDAAVLLTGCDYFGLKVGERFDLKDMGPIGELMRNSATVGDALRILLRHLHLHDRGAAPLLLASDQTSAILGYSVLRHGLPGTNHIHDAAIAIGYRLLCALCGPGFAPTRVQFAYGCPRNKALHSRLFRCKVTFDADLSGIVIGSASLSRSIEGADPQLRALLEKAILDAEASGPMTFGERLESALHQLVLSGGVSADAICSQFAISERTLRRRLREDGKSLQQFVNQTRYELARQLLRNSNMPISKIAAALHYADPNIFSRAFRKWACLSPKQWRAVDREGGIETLPTKSPPENSIKAIPA